MSRLEDRVTLITTLFAGVICLTNVFNYYFFISHDLWLTATNPSVWVLAILTALFYSSRWLPRSIIRVVQPVVFLLLSGPTILTSAYSFFGLWIFLLSLVLFYKYELMRGHIALKLSAIAVYILPFVILNVLNTEGLTGSAIRTVNYLTFLLSCLAYLFVIFEDEIRNLMASNRSKDAEIAEQSAEIARLQPLSVLGERVAHVTHSFKNNLNLLSTALFHLEQGGDIEKAAKKVSEFSRTINDRIDNILMVSRAGADQRPEMFDAARMLEGLNLVYLSEPTFLKHARIEMDAAEPTPLVAVRWDFLLMVENILKNALEALGEQGSYGTIRVVLKDRILALANDGGAMPLCENCHDSCLTCPRYGRPGQTTKSHGTGHGLAQVFAACRKYHWTLRIRTEGNWTRFEIGFPLDKLAQAAQHRPNLNV